MRDTLEEIKSHARRDLPNEACGYLAGKDGLITMAFPMTNKDYSPEHYSFDPAEQFEVLKETRNQGLEILANYHSHPKTPARPSEEDIKLAFDPDISYIIVSLAQEDITVKSYRINNSRVELEALVIVE